MKRIVFEIDTILHGITSTPDPIKLLLPYVDSLDETHTLSLLFLKESITPGMYSTLDGILKSVEKLCADNHKLFSEFEFYTNFSLNKYHKEYSKIRSCRYVTLDNFRLIAYLNHKFCKSKNKPLTKSNQENSFYLCKFGKINKPNRYLLYCFLKDLNLLDTRLGQWSLVIDNEMEPILNECKGVDLANLFPDVPDYSLSSMKKDHKILSDLDIRDTTSINGTFHYTGYPFSIEPYQQTLFSIVSESMIRSNSWQNDKNLSDLMITEKTWIPISVKHPMMLLGTSEQRYVMKELGFKSIDDFALCDMCSLENYYQVLNLFNECYQTFVNATPSELFEIAEHNYNLFEILALEDYHKIPKNQECTMISGLAFNPKPVKNKNFLRCITQTQYPNRYTVPYDWDWDAIDKFSSDK